MSKDEHSPRRPLLKPNNPCFSSGPCAKRPGWSPDIYGNAVLGRSHRSKLAIARIRECISKTRDLLKVPSDHLIAIVPGSDTGAMEMSLWSMLGARGVDILQWEHFGRLWALDITDQLQLPNARILSGGFDLDQSILEVDWSRDVVFTWNGTSTGVCAPATNWIPSNRNGLTICDATSAVFGIDLPFHLLDVVTFSWQKGLGGEAAHGVLVLSPRAIERLQSYNPPRPMPKLFRMMRNGSLLPGLFDKGVTINTISMLSVEDALDALQWGQNIGGLPAMLQRVKDNNTIIENWVNHTQWVKFLVSNKQYRSPTSVCLQIDDDQFSMLTESSQRSFIGRITDRLEREGVAFDINGFRTAPPCFRIWCGPTVDAHNLAALVSWMDWSFAVEKYQPKTSSL